MNDPSIVRENNDFDYNSSLALFDAKFKYKGSFRDHKN